LGNKKAAKEGMSMQRMEKRRKWGAAVVVMLAICVGLFTLAVYAGIGFLRDMAAQEKEAQAESLFMPVSQEGMCVSQTEDGDLQMRYRGLKIKVYARERMAMPQEETLMYEEDATQI
jgi:hypothetical protein